MNAPVDCLQAKPNSLLRLARGLQRKNVRGATFAISAMRRYGWLNHTVLFPLGGYLSVEVPLWRDAWDEYDVANYENEFVTRYAAEVKKLPEPVTLIDVGADIGVFSLKVMARCQNIQELVAFEPNADSFPILSRNCQRLRIPAKPLMVGISDAPGRAILRAPDGGGDYAANFIERTEAGDISIITLDSLELERVSLAIKIDVEGGELAVLKGAVQTIRAAGSIVIGMEAHPDVFKRTGRDPVECMRLLESLRPFQFLVSETGVQIDTKQDVFGAQLAPTQIYNIICRSL